jgi:hypothetical protein
MARLALVAAYSRRRRSERNCERASDTGLDASLVDVELPLHERDDSPVVEVRENRSRALPGVRQAL